MRGGKEEFLAPPPIMASSPLSGVDKGEKRGKLNAEGCRLEGKGEVRLSVGAGLKRQRGFIMNV